KLYKSKFDVRSAFLTIPVREEDIHKTAFVLPGFHLEFMRMPFGQINGPSVLARLMEATFGPLFDDNVNVYFDDITISHHTFDEHMIVLQKVLDAARSAGIKFAPDKTAIAVSTISV